MNVLIVDDDKTTVAFLKGAARATGSDGIDAAESGEEALGQVIRKRYDLITLDIQMPGASGLEILAVLRSMCPRAVIVIISGHIPSDLDEEAIAAADAVMSKPVPVESFAELVEAARKVMTALEEVGSLSTIPMAGPEPETEA